MTQQELELPKGWVETKLSSISQIVSGNPVPSGEKFFKNGKYNFVRVRDMGELKNETYLSHTNKQVNELAIDSLVLFPKGSVLFTKGGASSLLNQRAILNQECYVDGPIGVATSIGKIPSKLIYYFLKTIDFNLYSHGSIVPHVKISQIGNCLIPLPPLNEQKRILTKIEEIYSNIDSTTKSLEHTKLLLVHYRQSLLEFAFEGKLTEKWREENLTNLESGYNLIERIKIKDDEPLLENLPEKWALTSIGTLFKVKPGSTPSRENGAYWNGKISWVSSGEVKNHDIIETKEKITEDGFKNSSLMLYPSETVLLAMIGEGKTRGKVAILKIPATTNQNIAAILCADSEISSRYIFFWFLKRYTETRKAGSGGMQKALNSQRVRDQPLVLAPLEEQEQIVSQLEQGFSLIENSQRIVNSTLQTLVTMRMSVLKQAFEGKLVPQDPNDEPAEILLERIKKQKS